MGNYSKKLKGKLERGHRDVIDVVKRYVIRSSLAFGLIFAQCGDVSCTRLEVMDLLRVRAT